MPCWEVDYITVNLDVANVDLLKDVISSLGGTHVGSRSYLDNLRIDMGRGKIQAYGPEEEIAKLKAAYGDAALANSVRKVGWVLKRDARDSNKFTAKSKGGDEIQVKKLPDGRYKIETDALSPAYHLSAEQLLKKFQELAGGEVVKQKKLQTKTKVMDRLRVG